jgi:alkylated DNA repair dioxygenase AlkB
MSLHSRFGFRKRPCIYKGAAAVAEVRPQGNYVWVSIDGGNSYHALNEAQARRDVVIVGEPKENLLTDKQLALLNEIRDFPRGGMFLKGPQVTVARSLEKLGWVTLEDNGKMKKTTGRDDGERWLAKIPKPTDDA